MILSTLKEQTRSLHDTLDGSPRLRVLFSPDLTLSDYVALLESFRAVYAPLEHSLGTYFAHHGLASLDFESRRKLPLLDQDLGVLKGEKLSGAHIAPFRSAGEALGCLYVLEGATLGGQVIARAIRRRLGLTRESGLAFFESYQEAVMEKWHGFQDILMRAAQDRTQGEAMIESAKKTFGVFISHLNGGHVN